MDVNWENTTDLIGLLPASPLLLLEASCSAVSPPDWMFVVPAAHSF